MGGRSWITLRWSFNVCVLMGVLYYTFGTAEAASPFFEYPSRADEYEYNAQAPPKPAESYNNNRALMDSPYAARRLQRAHRSMPEAALQDVAPAAGSVYSSPAIPPITSSFPIPPRLQPAPVADSLVVETPPAPQQPVPRAPVHRKVADVPAPHPVPPRLPPVPVADSLVVETPPAPQQSVPRAPVHRKVADVPAPHPLPQRVPTVTVVAKAVKLSSAPDVKRLAALSPAAGATDAIALVPLPKTVADKAAAVPAPVTQKPVPAIPVVPIVPMVPVASVASVPMPAASGSAKNTKTTTLTPLPSVTVPEAAVGGVSRQSREILDTLPGEKMLSAVKKAPVTIDHARKSTLETDTETKGHEGMGISITIKRPRTDIRQMLERAYDALISGNQDTAIDLYQQALEMQPTNKLALFGLATTYHRAGQLQLARPLYGKLLALEPQNVEGLNNFLILLADEAPQGALTELKRLEFSHPTFSPIPAQMAAIYEKLGNYAKAADAMNRAIALSPENLKYRYNMAIILDKQGAWDDAAVYYQQLITASDRGEKLPTNPDIIQQRLTFIRTSKPKGAS